MLRVAFNSSHVFSSRRRVPDEKLCIGCGRVLARLQVSRQIALPSIIRRRWRWSGVLSLSIQSPGSAQRFFVPAIAASRKEIALLSHRPESHKATATCPKRAIILCKIHYTVLIMRDVPSGLTLTRDP